MQYETRRRHQDIIIKTSRWFESGCRFAHFGFAGWGRTAQAVFDGFMTADSTCLGTHWLFQFLLVIERDGFPGAGRGGESPRGGFLRGPSRGQWICPWLPVPHRPDSQDWDWVVGMNWGITGFCPEEFPTPRFSGWLDEATITLPKRGRLGHGGCSVSSLGANYGWCVGQNERQDISPPPVVADEF